MEQNLCYGYKYDKINKKYILVSEQVGNVKNIYSLFRYGFYIPEITKLLNGKSVYSVISDKIFQLIMDVQQYDNKFGEELLVNEDFKVNVYDILYSRKNINELIINPLNNLKENLKVINLYKSTKDMFLSDIDKVINIINNIENIEKMTKKYKTINN